MPGIPTAVAFVSKPTQLKLRRLRFRAEGGGPFPKAARALTSRHDSRICPPPPPHTSTPHLHDVCHTGATRTHVGIPCNPSFLIACRWMHASTAAGMCLAAQEQVVVSTEDMPPAQFIIWRLSLVAMLLVRFAPCGRGLQQAAFNVSEVVTSLGLSAGQVQVGDSVHVCRQTNTLQSAAAFSVTRLRDSHSKFCGRGGEIRRDRGAGAE